MSAAPSHDDLRDLLAAAALGALDEPDQSRVLQHVAQCADCANELDEYAQVVAAMSLLSPERQSGRDRHDALRARLLARARLTRVSGDIAGARAGRPSSPRPRQRLVREWAGWAVAAGLAGVLMAHHAVHRPVNYGWLIAGVVTVGLVVLAVVAGKLHKEVAALRDRLAALEQQSHEKVREGDGFLTP